MALMRYRRLDPVENMLDLVDLYGGRLLELPTFFDGSASTAWHPAVDLMEDGDNVLVRMDLPGLTKEDIDISFDGHILSITGQRREQDIKGEGGYWSRERYRGEFHRYVHIPIEVSSENLSAIFKDGVLEVMLPKSENSKVKKIPIESGEARK